MRKTVTSQAIEYEGVMNISAAPQKLQGAGNVSAVIMASGKSRRFGSHNKLLMPWGDGIVIDRILRATENISARVVVTRTEEVAEICRIRNINCIFHDLPHKSDTVRLGVQYLKEHCSGYSGIMFATADQPMLTAGSIQALIDDYVSDYQQSAEDCGHIWRLRCGDTPGNPVIFPIRFEDDLLTLPEGENGRYIIRRNIDSVKYTDIANPLEMRDIDSVEEYEEIKNSAGL